MTLKVDNPNNYRVALYIRLSKEDDKDSESQSITNQRSLLQRFADEQKLEIYGEYIDDGFSGTDFNRPGFLRMIKDIEAKKVNMVITKDMSRLGRDYILTGYYQEKYFPENHVRYISLLDHLDTGVDNGNGDLTPFKAIINDLYAKDISKKIKSVKQYKQQHGLFIGGKASYGYKISEKNKLAIDEVVSDNVRRMFQLALEGKSSREIAKIFNLEEIPTPSAYANLRLSKKGIYNGLWSSESITYILKNRLYLGHMVQGRSKKVSYKSRKSIKVPKEDWIVVENTHPPIVDQVTFDKVQMLLSARTKTRSRTYDYLLKGLVYCHECGYKLAVINRKLAHDETLYFLCRTYQRFTNYEKCFSHNIRVDLVTEAVVEQIKMLCQPHINIQSLEKIALSQINKLTMQDTTLQNITKLQWDIKELGKNLDEVYSDKLKGHLEEVDFKRIYDKMKSDRLNLQAKMELLLNQKKKANCPSNPSKEVVKRFMDTMETNKELLFSLIERIEITKEKEILIYLKNN